MSLASIQAKLNKKFKKLANRPVVPMVLGPSLTMEERSVKAYVNERHTAYLIRKARGNMYRHKFPGKDIF